MPNTPVYGWPYQSLGDPPDGAALGEELGLAIEATMSDVDTRLQSAESDISSFGPRITTLETRVGCRLRRVANQSVNNITETAMAWDTEDDDPNGMWAIGTPTVVTITELGTWAILARVVSSGLAGSQYCYLAVTSSITGVPSQFLRTMEFNQGSVMITLPLAIGDTISFAVFHTSGAPRNFTGFFSAVKTAP